MDLLIDIYGTRIGASGERIILTFPKGGKKKEYSIRRLEKIVIMRPASLTTDAVELAIKHDVDIVYLGSFGKPIGRLFSSKPKGLASLRKAQLEASVSPEWSFKIAKELVRSKCANQLYLLRYLAYRYKKSVRTEFMQARALFETLDSVPFSAKGKEHLLGIEGYIAERYFSGLKKFHPFPGRRPQGRDPFNSALNYGYGILYSEVERACLYAGLDPHLGLYHSERYGKPALVLDLVEEFRVPIVDSVLLPLFIEKKLGQRKHFERIAAGEYRLSAEGKGVVVKAIMKRLNEITPWREKNYTLKQIIGNQVGALGRHFAEKEEKYSPFRADKILSMP